MTTDPETTHPASRWPSIVTVLPADDDPAHYRIDTVHAGATRYRIYWTGRLPDAYDPKNQRPVLGERIEVWWERLTLTLPDGTTTTAEIPGYPTLADADAALDRLRQALTERTPTEGPSAIVLWRGPDAWTGRWHGGVYVGGECVTCIQRYPTVAGGWEYTYVSGWHPDAQGAADDALNRPPAAATYQPGHAPDVDDEADDMWAGMPDGGWR